MDFASEINARLENSMKHIAKSKFKDRASNIYILECHDFVKVGIADDVNDRLMQLQVGCPYELRLLATFAVNKAKECEERLHVLWKQYEVRGEWFRVPAGELASAINAACFKDIFQP